MFKGGILVIEVKNVTKKYGKAVAVDNISFSIEEGEIVGLLRTKWSWKKYNDEYDYRFYRTNCWRYYS